MKNLWHNLTFTSKSSHEFHKLNMLQYNNQKMNLFKVNKGE